MPNAPQGVPTKGGDSSVLIMNNATFAPSAEIRGECFEWRASSSSTPPKACTDACANCLAVLTNAAEEHECVHSAQRGSKRTNPLRHVVSFCDSRSVLTRSMYSGSHDLSFPGHLLNHVDLASREQNIRHHKLLRVGPSGRDRNIAGAETQEPVTKYVVAMLLHHHA
jgi:hypothetical protein